jgi:hypothetical protein
MALTALEKLDRAFAAAHKAGLSSGDIILAAGKWRPPAPKPSKALAAVLKTLPKLSSEERLAIARTLRDRQTSEAGESG